MPTKPYSIPLGRFLVLVLALWVSPLRAYVTSAVLEYTVDDYATFYINGTCILPRSELNAFDFRCLSTSDGTLPMGVFDSNHDNVLAVEDHDTEGLNINISYRLTVHVSDGDPIVVWSVPAQAKMLHLTKDQPDPEGWMRNGFDDSSWDAAVAGTNLRNVAGNCIFPSLSDPHFALFFGIGAYVPHFSHNASLVTGTQDHDLYRTHFRFPNHPSKVRVLVYPPQGVSRAQRMAVRLAPGPDATDYSQFNILAWLPKGLVLTNASPGYKWAPDLGRLSWSFDRRDLGLGYAKIHAVSVISAPGWSQPQKALGPFKYGKVDMPPTHVNIPAGIFYDGAKYSANRPGWFRMGAPQVDLGSARPQILGVIFHSQMQLGGTTRLYRDDCDNLYLNYSFDGGAHEALPNDVDISHHASPWSHLWIDGYYDATEDRKWTWDELRNLSVKIEARARGSQYPDLMSSIECTVKYYVPGGASPWFYATVTDPECSSLELNTGIYRNGQGLIKSDPVDIPVNVALCSPTPVPPPTETPVPLVRMVIPTPTPVGMALRGGRIFGLENLKADPSPFNFAGTFISFDVKKDVVLDVTLNIYSSETTKLVRQMKLGTFHKGDNNQVFYDALDENKQLLQPGTYLFELVAEQKGHKETLSESFEFTRNRGGE